MDARNCQILIIADAPEALVELCGISLLERLLRILERLGCTAATISSRDADAIAAHLTPPSWARASIATTVRARRDAPIAIADVASSSRDLVVIPAGAYYDPRLLRALLMMRGDALLIDSAPPPDILPLVESVPRKNNAWVCGPAKLSHGWLAQQDPASRLFESLGEAAESGALELVDAAKEPRYVTDMRREIHPLWFAAPRPQHRRAAERLLLDAVQNGTLDLPAKFHGPIETCIISKLCWTAVTPMQITLFIAAVSAVTTAFFATGRLVEGTLLALIVGVLDGVDGKQARVKVETTELGKREHVLDYLLELSWWTALAYHFAINARVPNAFALLALLVGSDVLDRLAKGVAKKHTGRNLDDVAPIDRFVRLIGGRRNVYVWIFACGLALGAADKAFVTLCYWGALTAAIHVMRAWWIVRERRGR